MTATYTLYFAWVAAGTAWSSALARFDEHVFDLVIEHDEGQIPTAAIEVVNPRIGFIAPGRQYWAWLSYEVNGQGALPLFHGRLVGIPTEIVANTIKMQFIARAPDYIRQKQLMAELLKTLPQYDPIFFDVTKRDDPDSILEGWSALYHVDRLTQRVSASEILVGEDGTIYFGPADVFYDNLNIKLLQSPLKAVNVKMEVTWAQQWTGTFYMGSWAWPTLGSDAFVGDWPKTGASLGGGWHAGVAFAGERDPSIATAMLLTAVPTVQPLQYKWVNKEKTHEDGDTMSVSINYQPPPPGFRVIKLREVDIPGFLDPYAVDGDGNPAPINQPLSISIDYLTYRTFALDFENKQSIATLNLYYEADRKRSERIDMTVQADVQPILIDPLITEDTEQLTLKSGDLSLPLINLLNWDSVSGQSVALGQIIFPDNPLVPGQTSSQIAVQAGVAGIVEPVFSNIPGVTTTDGTVIWSSLGNTPPTDSAQDWLHLAPVPLGTIIFPKPLSGIADQASTLAAGSLNYPPMGVAIAKYTILTHGNGGPGAPMLECTSAGIMGGLSGAPPAVFENFTNPTGQWLYICVQAGTTGDFHTSFDGSTLVHDGSVIWQNMGAVNLPIGGWGGATPARTYFQQDRGKLSLEHGMSRARAKLRRRARAVQISYDTRFETAAMLSCRMNGHVTDVRLPGGSASGKVVSYRIEAHGNDAGVGVFKGSVVLGCSIGNELIAVSPPPTPPIFTEVGVPTYVSAGYVTTGYQNYQTTVSGAPPGTLAQQGINFGFPPNPSNWYTTPPTIPPLGYPIGVNSVWAPGPVDPHGEQIGYTPPSGTPNDDGLTFPVSPGDVVMTSQWHGIPTTLNPNNLQRYQDLLDTAIQDAIIAFDRSQGIPIPIPPFTVIPGVNWIDIWNAVQQAILNSVLQGEGLWYELVLKPLTNGPFTSAYVVQTTPLIVPKTIDLSAMSIGFLR